MGVYINMEMPNKKNGAVLIIYPNGDAVFEDGYHYKAIPVPPHGRCIDADALYRKMFVGPDGQIYPNNDVDNWPHTMAFREIKHHILFAPTIIDAEEGE